MKNMYLTKWICENEEKWYIICRIIDKRFTVEEVNNVLKEMKELSDMSITTYNEFSAIFTVILSQYYYDLYPDAPKD